MAIEIKQLQIKSTVQGSPSGEAPFDAQSLKQEILSQCRRMVSELIDKQKER